jgi:hypothetical protein
MPNVRRRVERLERFLAPEPASDPCDEMKSLALQSLPEEDLDVLEDVIAFVNLIWPLLIL